MTANDDETRTLARGAAESALAFADFLAGRCTAIAAALRNGNDVDALNEFGSTTEDLEHFLTFLVLIGGQIQPSNADLASTVQRYRDRLMGALEGMQPALGDIDLVEVADAIDEDIVASLRAYKDLDDQVQEALDQAA